MNQFIEHSFISSSSLKTTIACSMSPWLSANAKAIGAEVLNELETEEYTAEGNVAHGHLEERVIQDSCPEAPKPEDVTVEMYGHISGCLDFLEHQVTEFDGHYYPALLSSEQRVDLTDVFKVDKLTADYSFWGTADVVYYNPAVGRLYVADLKYGEGVLVYAQDNPQFKSYALGVLAGMPQAQEVIDVVLICLQPRLDNYTVDVVPVDELYDWRDAVLVPACNEVFDAPKATPSNEACQFCSGAAVCNRLAEKALPPKAVEAEMLTLKELGDVLANRTAYNRFIDAAVKLGKSVLQQGKKIPGVKQVPGNKVKSYNTGEVEVAEHLVTLGVTPYDEKLKSPAQALKAIADKDDRQEFLETFVSEMSGNPIIVSESDPRNAVKVVTEKKIDKLMKVN